MYSSIPVRSRNVARNLLLNRSNPPPPLTHQQQQQRPYQRQQQQQQQQVQQHSSQEQVLPDYVIEPHPPSELVKFLNELGLPIQEYHLQRPQPVMVQEMFEFLLSMLIPDSFKEDQEVQINLQQQVPEVYETATDSTKVSSVYREMKDFLKQIRFTDFSPNDILQPNAVRLKIILSVIYNYAIHESAAREYFESIDYAATEFAVNVQDLTRENYSLKQDVQERQEQYEQLEVRITQLQAESNQWETRIKKKQNDTATVINGINQMKQERQNLKDDMQQCHYHVLEIAKQLKDLTNIINLDVNQLGATNERLEDSFEQQKQFLNNLQQEAEALDREYTLKKSLYNNTESDNEAINKLKKTLNELDRTRKSRQALMNEIINFDTHYKALVQNSNMTERQLAVKDLQIKKLDEQQEKKRESMMSYYDEIEKRAREFENHFNKCAQEAEIYLAEINAKLEEDEERKGEFETFVKSYIEQAEQLQQKSSKLLAESKLLLAGENL